MATGLLHSLQRRCWSCGRWALLLALGGCIDSYIPDELPATAPSYLVVDGFVNGSGRTRIRLSRTVAVGSKDAPPAERGARVVVADNTGATFTLAEVSPGLYRSDSLTLPAGRRYLLRIGTAAGPGRKAASYESAPVVLKVTPPIDALRFGLENNQVSIRLDTHDDQRQSGYYRWQFIETWQFNAAYHSAMEYYAASNPASAVYGVGIGPRTTPIYTCYRTETSSYVSQATTTQLSRDALLNHEVLAISSRAERIRIRYSVLVSQYAETPEEYAYYEQLRKNTEAIGTVNDPIPTQLTGNVRRVGSADNASEPVIGYVGAHTVQQRRLFINNGDLRLPSDWQYNSPYDTCETIFIDPKNADQAFSHPELIPLYPYFEPNLGVEYILGGSSYCTDCRERGAPTPPSFW